MRPSDGLGERSVVLELSSKSMLIVGILTSLPADFLLDVMN